MFAPLTRISICLAILTIGANTASGDTLENIGVGLAVALPLTAGGITVYKDDWTGVAQLAVDGVATVGTAEILKNVVREQRPDKSDFHSFPSGTEAIAA